MSRTEFRGCVDTALALEIVRQIKCASPRREVLILADDEIAFTRERQKKDRAVRLSLFAIVSGGFDELVIDRWLGAIESYIYRRQCRGASTAHARNGKTKSNVMQINIGQNGELGTETYAEIQLCEVGDFIAQLERGNPRAVDLLEGQDYDFFLEQVDAATRASKQNCYWVIHHSPDWIELRDRIGGKGLLYGPEYARSCIAMIKGMLKCKASEDLVANYVNLLFNRAKRSIAARERPAANMVPGELGIPNYEGNLSTFVEAVIQASKPFWNAVQEIIQMEPDPERRNLRGLADDQYSFIQNWLNSLRAGSMKQWVSHMKESHEFLSSLKSLSVNMNQQRPEGLASLLQKLEMPVDAERIVMIARCGSWMYNLHTKISDEDYAAVYVTSTPLLLSRSPSPDFHTASVISPLGFASDKFGEVEYDAREFGKFVAECCKGNPRNIELLFLDPLDAIYVAPEFEEIRKIRALFLTRRCLSQYYGFVSDRLSMVQRHLEDETNSGAFSDKSEAAVSKLLYHAYHKLFEARRIATYKQPCVRLANCSEEREFIMQMRTTRPLAGDLTPRRLLENAEKMLAEVRALEEMCDQQRRDAGLPVRPPEVDIAKVRDIICRVRFYHAMESPPLRLSHGRSLERIRSDASSQGGSTSAEMECGDDASVVQQCLDEIEEQRGIRVIFAAEVSSHVLGTAHSGSDHDVAAIFVYPMDHYFSIKPMIKGFKSTFPAEAGSSEPDVEVALWEIRHAWSLLAANNPTLLEAFSSPIVYRTFCSNESSTENWPMTKTWDCSVRDLTAKTVDRRKLALGALSQGDGNFQLLVRKSPDGEVLQKKYVHVARRILLVEWLLSGSNRDQWPPPLRVSDLLAGLQHCDESEASDFSYSFGFVPSNVRIEIGTMIQPENLSGLQLLGARNPTLDAWAENRIAFAKNELSSKKWFRTTSGAEGSNAGDATSFAEWDKILIPLLRCSSNF